MTSTTRFVLGIDPGVPRDRASAASAVLELAPDGSIGVARRAEAFTKTALATWLQEDPILADSRLCLAAVNGPLTPVRLESKPLRARLVEIRMTRGAFAGSLRGPQPPWVSSGRSGWLRYREATGYLDHLQERGLPYIPMPPEGTAPVFPPRGSVEVYAKAILSLLLPRAPLGGRPMASEFMGQIDDWLFPQLFLSPPPESGEEPAPPTIQSHLNALAPGLHLAPGALEEADRITRIRRPFSRREPLRAYIAALQGILALTGGGALVGAEGDGEGYFLLPATWHADWEEEWQEPRRFEPRVRRVRVERAAG